MAQNKSTAPRESVPSSLEPDPRPTTTKSIPVPIAISISTLVLGVATIAHALSCYRTGGALDTVSGAWAALADDLYRGTFYRPLLSTLGWGGTRAFPLYFSLHALAMRCGLSLMLAGYVLSAVSGVLAVFGTYFLLRRIEVRRFTALVCSPWVLAPLAAQKSLVSYHPDLLAAGLCALGAGYCLSGENRRCLVLGSVCFALAFAAKMTAISAAIAVFVYWINLRRRRSALQLAALVCALDATVLMTIQVASSGRAWHILFASGGTSVRSVVHSPESFVQVLLYDPAPAAFLILTLFAILTVNSKLLSFPKILFLITLLATIMIYSAPGASTNHLLELQLAMVAVLGLALDAGSARRLHRPLGIVIIIAALLIIIRLRNLPPTLTNIRDALQIARTRSGPILAEDPLVPILAGQRPCVLDPFMMNLLSDQHPEINAAMQAALGRHAFAAVVLEHDPDTREGRNWYGFSHFGHGFVQALEQNYARLPSSGRLVVFQPR